MDASGPSLGVYRQSENLPLCFLPSFSVTMGENCVEMRGLTVAIISDVADIKWNCCDHN